MNITASALELHHLASQTRQLLKEYLHVRNFQKGEFLWMEGETSGMLVAIRSGRVKVYRLLPTGRSITLYLFGPGDVFGFLPFLDGRPYPAYAQAIDDVDAEVMSRSALLDVLRAEPEISLGLIELLGLRLRAAFDLIQNISTPGARSRVASALLGLIPESVNDDPVAIKFPVAAHELAAAIGIAPETLSRALSSLADEGILKRIGHGRYHVLDRKELRLAAEPVV